MTITGVPIEALVSLGGTGVAVGGGASVAAGVTLGGTGMAVAPGVVIAAGASLPIGTARMIGGGASVAAGVTIGGTGTSVLRITGVSIELLCTIGGVGRVRPAGSTVTPPYPIFVSVAGVDVSAIRVAGTTWSRGVNGTSSATVILEDLEGIVPWPLPPGDDPDAPDKALAPVVIAGRKTWFKGVVTVPDRDVLGVAGTDSPAGWRYTLACEGDERILQIDPQDTYSASDYLVVTAPNGMLLMRAVDTSDLAPAETGYPWVGKRHRTVGSALRNRLSDTTWIWPPGATEPETLGSSYWGGVAPADLTAPSRLIAPFHLTDDFTDVIRGGFVPSRMRESRTGQNMREGVWVETRRPDVHAYVTGGPTGAGHDVIQVETSFFELAQLAGLVHMSTRKTWERHFTAVLAAPGTPLGETGEVAPAGAPEPEPGRLLLVRYRPYVSEPRYFLITNVSGRTVAPAEGVDGVEWTVDFGNGTRPSFVVREGDAAADEVPPAPQASGCEVGAISWVGYEARQYVPAYPLDDDGKRMRVAGGTVEWTLWKLAQGSSSWANIGPGSALAGWWITEGRHTDVVFSDTEPLGYAFCEVCTGAEGTGPLPGDRLEMHARYLP